MAKVGRDAFLYLDPVMGNPAFAQCSTCRDWVTGDNKCCIHGPDTLVLGSMSCGLYVYGAPMPAGTTTLEIVTPEESGLVDREVRCENCNFAQSDATFCGFYYKLNEALPDIFDLIVEIDPKGCCNANEPRET